MARNIPLQAIRTTRAALTTQAGASGLLVGEPYLITDEGRLAMGTGVASFVAAATEAQGALAATAVQGDGTILKTVALTQAAYDALTPKIATTLYVTDEVTAYATAPIEQIAGINPTLDLDFSKQSYRVYDGANGLKALTPAALLTDLLTFTRASPATYFDAKGVMQSATNNVPRIDYDPATGECNGLLIEEARANLLLNSLLDGTSLATQSVTVTAVAHTLSFYGTGTVTLSGTHVATVVGTGAYPTRTTLTFTPTAGTLTLTVSGTVQFANCGIGGFATSFIPTAGTSLTRAADVASITGTNFSKWYRQGVGSVFVESLFGASTSNGGRIVDFTDGSTDNRMSFLVIATGSLASFGIKKDGVAVTATKIIPSAKNFNFTAAVAINSSTSAFVYGGLEAIETSHSTPVVIDRLHLGSSGVGTEFGNQHISRFFYCPVCLSNNILQALTAE